MNGLTKNAKDLLRTIAESGSWGVYASTIIEAAQLLRAGYARADDDYEGPRLYQTDKGMKAAKRLGLLGGDSSLTPTTESKP